MLNGILSKSQSVMAVLLISIGVAGELNAQNVSPILRLQVDAARDRIWILTRSGVDVYDSRTQKGTRHVPLPDWHWAGEPFGCSPDLALGPRGEALISSDVVPTIWRVDPATLAVSRHELVQHEDADKDVGFSGLAFSAEQGVWFGASSFHGSLWRIDPSLRWAEKMPSPTPIRKPCGTNN
jgi:hypothetical protein